MAFNVGIGVLAKMQELSDRPSTDSKFLNSPDQKSRSEYGYGIKYDYRAVGELKGTTWDWQVYAYKLPTDAVLVSNIEDVRGQLPIRAGHAPYPVRTTYIDMFTVHYTAGPPAQTVQQVAAYQVGPNSQLDFPAIAYHLFVEQTGKAYWCHALNVRTWGSGGAGINERAVHCCYSGNVEPNNMQIQGIKECLAFAEMTLGRTLIVRGHKDDDATACPGAKWDTWKGKIR